MAKKKETKIYETLNLLWATGLTVAFSIAAIIFSWGKYVELYKADFYHFVSSAILGACAIVLFARYVIATHYELTMLSVYLNGSSAPRAKPPVYVMMLLLSIALGCAMATTDKIYLYSGIMSIMGLTDIWGSRYLIKTIDPLISKKLAHEKDSSRREIINAIRDYYISNPTLERGITLMYVNWIVVCLGIIYYFSNNVFIRHSAYVVAIANFIGGEIVISIWRRRRDAAIERFENT